MAIISQIGRRSPGVRLLVGAIYAVLLLGTVTMIYPFLIMVSGSTKSAVDIKDVDIIPAFLRNDGALYRKYIEGLFNESVEVMNNTYDSSIPSFELVRAPDQPNRQLAGEWLAFLDAENLPGYFVGCGTMAADITRTIPQGLREFKRYVAKRYGSDIADVNAALGTDFVGWNAFFVLPENYAPRVRMPQKTPLAAALNDFKSLQPRGFLYCHSPEGFFKRQYLSSVYSRDIADYNKTHGTSYGSYEEVHLSGVIPARSYRGRGAGRLGGFCPGESESSLGSGRRRCAAGVPRFSEGEVPFDRRSEPQLRHVVRIVFRRTAHCRSAV